MKSWNFLLVGVGGQGTLTASNILAEVGLRAGYEVKKSEIHGMAQRGGSVSSHVRWGEMVASPMIGKGEVDVLVAFERLEALRYVEMLRPGAKVLVNDHVIVPVTVTIGDSVYPDEETQRRVLAQMTDEVVYVPGVQVAEELGNARANNVVVLGVLSTCLDVAPEIWEEVIAERVPPKYRDLNIEAFRRGRELRR